MPDTHPRDRRRFRRGSLRFLPDALHRTLRFVARHVHGFYAALVAFLSIVVVLGLAAVAVFVGFAEVVRAGFTQPLDDAALRWIAGHRSAGLDRAAVEVTALGSTLIVWIVVGLASVFLWLTRHRYSVYILLLGVLGGKLLNRVLKAFYERDRPDVVAWATDVHSASFPSGHAMTAIIAYSSVAYIVSRLEPRRTLRSVTWAVAIAVILGVGLSRVYLGVHYPSDIAAGFLAGLAWVLFVSASISAVRFYSDRRPEVEEEEHDLHVEEERAAGVRP